MLNRIIILFILISSSVVGQEIGSVYNGKYSVKLLKTNDLYTCFYSDINSKSYISEKSFDFPDKEVVYKIIMDGFENKKRYQIFVLTDTDIVIKFEYVKINGIRLLKIKHNNLNTKTTGISTFINKEQIDILFGNFSIKG